MKVTKGYAAIDVCLVVVRTDTQAIAIDTASKLGVSPQIETQEAIKVIKDGRVLAQKPQEDTITSHQLTLTDNIFYPDVVKIFQGGTVSQDEDGNTTYEPPEIGSKDKGEVFEVDSYSAVYDEAGNITNYEKTTFPGCRGSWISLNSEDNVFRVPEYTINSYAKKGQKPYKIVYVKELPEIESDEGNESVALMENNENADFDNTGLTVR